VVIRIVDNADPIAADTDGLPIDEVLSMVENTHGEVIIHVRDVVGHVHALRADPAQQVQVYH
jgi:hypothetical protein